MANQYNSVATSSPTNVGENLVQTAYDRFLEFSLRAIPTFRQLADKRPVQQAMPGSSIVFQLYADMTPATTALNELVDPDAVSVPETDMVTVTLAEYGNASLTTRKLELFSLSDVDPAIADILAYNMADSMDVLSQNVLKGGTNVIAEQGTTGGSLVSNLNGGTFARTSIDDTDTFKSRDVRFGVAKLRAQKVVPRRGDMYACYVHPDVSHDLRAETGSAAWRDPHVYSSPDSIWAGEIGAYEGAYFIESPRCYSAADGAGSGTPKTTVYRSYLAGRQALAEAVSEEPHTVIGNVTDKLMRFRPIGWYGVLGWALYRQEALIRIETSSSIGTPAAT